jgi:ketosteroid isomerase-like protein
VSGATVPWRYWAVVSFRNGKALRIEWYTDRAEAVQAAGHQD